MIIYGLLGLGVAFLASLMDKLLTMALKMFGIIGGPMLGVFCLGLFTPIANSVVCRHRFNNWLYYCVYECLIG